MASNRKTRVKANAAEQAKYNEYVELMRAHNIEPCSPAEWLHNYRTVQARLKKKEGK